MQLPEDGIPEIMRPIQHMSTSATHATRCCRSTCSNGEELSAGPSPHLLVDPFGIHLQVMRPLVLGNLEGVEQMPEVHHLDAVVQGQLHRRPHATVHSRVLAHVEERKQVQ